MEAGGFAYLCDSYADDLPYWLKGPNGPHLIIPYSLDANDMRFVNPQGFGGGDEFFTYLKDSFDVLYAEGATSPKMMTRRAALPRRRPARPRGVADAFPRLHQEPRQGLGADAAAYRTALARPSETSRRRCARASDRTVVMSQKTLAELNACSKDDFVAALANVFEYSPWIAEAAAAKRPFAGVTQLFAAMREVVEDAAPGQRLALIRCIRISPTRPSAPTDLTAESNAEQNSARARPAVGSRIRRLRPRQHRLSRKIRLSLYRLRRAATPRIPSCAISRSGCPTTPPPRLRRRSPRSAASPRCAPICWCPATRR